MFPSLKGKELQLPLEFWMSSMKLEFGTNNLHLYKDDVYGITLKDIQQHCLDKQKLRDAYEKLKNKVIAVYEAEYGFGVGRPEFDDFEEELGL